MAPADLLAPVGLVEPFLFPGESSTTLSDRLSAYIADAVTREPDNKDAAKAWAYHRTFMAVYVRLTANPHQETANDQGSHSYLMSQIENVRQLAHDQLMEYRRLTATVATRASGTKSTRVDFTW